MAFIMTNNEFVNRARQALGEKTIYVSGCIGSPMTEANKNRYIQQSSKNSTMPRKLAIKRADAETFGFDCICLIKSILWGWDGNKHHPNGGTKYASNGLRDCTSTDFFNEYCTEHRNAEHCEIIPGEILYMRDSTHIGIAIENDQVIEATLNGRLGADGVVLTPLHNRDDGRRWDYVGRCRLIDYKEKIEVFYLKRDLFEVLDGISSLEKQAKFLKQQLSDIINDL